MNSILVFLVVLVVLLLIGAPVATSFGLSSIVYILMQSVPLSIVAQRMISSVDSLTIMCVPLFILAGELMGAGGIAKRLVRVINLIFGNVTGGLALVTVVVCAFFAALTGSAMACSVAIGSIMLPYMLDAGYDRRFSAAIIASAACLGPIIPPSTSLIVYGATAQVSIAKLYQAGLPSGLIIGAALVLVAVGLPQARLQGPAQDLRPQRAEGLRAHPARGQADRQADPADRRGRHSRHHRPRHYPGLHVLRHRHPHRVRRGGRGLLLHRGRVRLPGV